MGMLLEADKSSINSKQISENYENDYENGEIPHEYPFPCPLLTPENLGYSRPEPYPYMRY